LFVLTVITLPASGRSVDYPAGKQDRLGLPRG